MAGTRKNRVPVKLVPSLDGEPKMPSRSHPDDAGWDLYVSETVTIPAHSFADVPSGVHVQLPNGYWGFLTGRSSTIRKRGLLVVTGIIDTGYTGELFSAVQNLKPEPVTLEKGERIAQLILLPNSTAASLLHQVEEFAGEATRGSAGFGSSGL